MTRDYGYLTHYLRQSFGWVKIAEHAIPTEADVQLTIDEIRNRHPRDETRFEFRLARKA
jgi:hypothetical protein